MAAPNKVLELVERFGENLSSYQSNKYKETEVRREFIDPFFKALGWDIDNSQGYPEALKEVIHEATVKVEGKAKAPDYLFRINGINKFFLEAKKPYVSIKNDPHPAFQLRRYAWSAKLPLSVLTDFEELAIYDCRIPPKLSDNTKVACLSYIKFEEYADRWDELESVFSPHAIRDGSFDKYAADVKNKKGTAEVDDAFLKEIEGWRELLAQNIALRNPALTQRELNTAVQKTIDRIIFLRICEDRGIEPYNVLGNVADGKNIYARLGDIFQRADDRYNSGLFHFRQEKNRAEEPDSFTLGLSIDDKPLKEILKGLYYPVSPYEFSVLPADILGQVYEQFLGKVIVLDAKHKATVEEKPEVKKAGGVYYTPTYIVDYIVQNTVGKLLEGKTPNQISADLGRTKTPPLRVLDPACGSGSFLIGAYQYLLNWHLTWYTENDPEKYASPKTRSPRLYQGKAQAWRLTTDERKRILLTHIYGVDIDAQAVEVTKLSLLLKMLEGESNESLVMQTALFQARVLPDLEKNIKSGNSLIESDFDRQAGMFDEEEFYRINAFDWGSIEGFQQIIADGGFDAVIGNPPWISLTGKFGANIHTQEEINYLVRKHQGNSYMPNMYEYFVSKGLKLSKNNGYFGFVVPDRLGFNEQFVALRRTILTTTTIRSLVYKVPFPKITADTLVFIFEKAIPKKNYEVSISKYGRNVVPRLQASMLEHPNYVFEVYESKEVADLVDRLLLSNETISLDKVVETTSGFGGKSKLIAVEQNVSEQIKVLKGDSIERYAVRKSYWFDFRKENITGRTTDRRKLGASPKILLRKTGNRIIAALDASEAYPEQSLYFLFNADPNYPLEYLLGVLNSKLMTFFYRAKALTNAESIAQVKKADLDKLPIRKTSSFSTSELEEYSQLIKNVGLLGQLKIQYGNAQVSQERQIIRRRLENAEGQIDSIVYKLYGLEMEEISLVESSQ